MLIKASALDAIRRGAITLLFRRRDHLAVRTGSVYRTPVGMVAIESVDIVRLGELTSTDARSAGYRSLRQLRADLERWPGASVFRVRVRHAGEDPRIALRNSAELTPAEVGQVRDRLARLDRADPDAPWTRRYLTMIRDQPAVLAARLAASVSLPTPLFKRRVRQLKELGLTESLRVGYRLSPRGEVVLGVLESSRRRDDG